MSKTFIKKYFSSFFFFYDPLKYRIFLVLIISVIVGVLDGFGLAMFLPLLQLVGGSNEATGEGMGNLEFVVDGLGDLGLSLNLKTILGVLVVFFLFKGIISYMGNVYQVNIRQLFLRKIRLDLLHSFNYIKFKKFVQWDVGRIQNAMTTETERIATAFVHYFKTINQSINVVIYAGFAFMVDSQFAGLVILGGGVSHFFYIYIYNLSRKASRKLTKGNNFFHGLIVQFINNFKYLKATGRHLLFGEKLKKAILYVENENKKLGVYGALLQASREPIMIVVVSLVILLQTEVLGSPLAPILISLLFFYRALTSLNGLQSTWNLFIKFSGSLENIDHFQTELQQSREKRKGSRDFSGLESTLELKNVNFTYQEKTILRDISLTITQNESIAFVGESGSGKTTLLNIITGLLRPTSGRYLVDSIPSEDWDEVNFQKRIGFITQEPVIFNASIFDNITFWATRNDENIKRFNNAIEMAALIEFIDQLDQKEETILGYSGINLSGGQKQRISIARELFRDIDILVLDEATSALDSETENVIQSNLEKLKGKYTIILVSHRLSTIKNADRIGLIVHGQLINILPFDELIKKEVKFRNMVELQEI